jgi:excisionase family DNA binding protein
MSNDPFAALAALPALLQRMEERLAQLEQPDRVLKTSEAARLLRIGQAELLALVRAGKVPGHWIGSGYKFSERQLLDYLRQEAARAINEMEQAM